VKGGERERGQEGERERGRTGERDRRTYTPHSHATYLSSCSCCFFFFTLVTGPRRSLSLKLNDTKVYEPQIRAHDVGGTAAAALHGVVPHVRSRRHVFGRPPTEFFIDKLLVRIHLIIVMIKWTGLAPWEFEFPSLTSAAAAMVSVEAPPSTLNLTPSTLKPQPSTLDPQPYTLHPQPSTLNLKLSTLNPQPSTLEPQPSTLNPQP